jgi:hypothetical protein
MLTIHKVVNYERGPANKRVSMVQASFTDETGHHTNHFTRLAWDAKVAKATNEREWAEAAGRPVTVKWKSSGLISLTQAGIGGVALPRTRYWIDLPTVVIKCR